VADPSIFSKTMQTNGRIFSVYDEYSDQGLEDWNPGENDIAAGRNRIKEYLKTGRLKFFRGRTVNIWREMAGLHWRRMRSLQDVNAPEEEADVDNHGPDALRYLVMSRPDAAVVNVPVKPKTHEERQAEFRKRHIKAAVARHHQQFRKDEDDFV